MSTITDLFNIRIGLGSRSFYAEILENGEVVILGAQDRPPLKTGAAPARYRSVPFEAILRSENVTKESVYCIVPPSYYYRNSIVLPFSERQKIESTIKFEVGDSIPVADGEFITDFLVFGAERAGDGADSGSTGSLVCSFTISKEAVSGLLEGFGPYRENLKGLIPYDAAFFHAARAVIDSPSFLCMDIRSEAVSLMHVREGRIENSLLLRRVDAGQYGKSLASSLLLLEKTAQAPPLFVNRRTSAGEEFIGVNEGVLGELGIGYLAFPAHKLGEGAASGGPSGVPAGDFGPDLVAIAGGLLLSNQPAQKRVNLLKEEFRAKPRGYIRIKDFATLGAVLFVLLVLSLANLFIELGSAKSRNRELRLAFSELGAKVFQKPNVGTKDAQASLDALQAGIGEVEASIDRAASAVEVLRELSSYLPQDVSLEFTDIIIDKGHVKFAGKARAFADIDRIKEALSTSEAFSEVTVTNTGTTGSTEGFAVTFLFDIGVKPRGVRASSAHTGGPGAGGSKTGKDAKTPGAAGETGV